MVTGSARRAYACATRATPERHATAVPSQHAPATAREMAGAYRDGRRSLTGASTATAARRLRSSRTPGRSRRLKMPPHKLSEDTLSCASARAGGAVRRATLTLARITARAVVGAPAVRASARRDGRGRRAASPWYTLRLRLPLRRHGSAQLPTRARETAFASWVRARAGRASRESNAKRSSALVRAAAPATGGATPHVACACAASATLGRTAAVRRVLSPTTSRLTVAMGADTASARGSGTHANASARWASRRRCARTRRAPQTATPPSAKASASAASVSALLAGGAPTAAWTCAL